MGVFDKFLNIMKIDDEDDDYDGYDTEDDDDDDDYEEPARKSFFKKKEKDFDYDLEDAIVKETRAASKPAKVTPINNRARKSANGMEVCVIKPTSFEDAHDVSETLLSNRTVLLNFEGLDVDLAQRIIDYTCGTCAAIKGNLQKVSSFIFIVTPKTVDISGDLQDIITDAFEVPSIKKDF